MKMLSNAMYVVLFNKLPTVPSNAGTAYPLGGMK